MAALTLPSKLTPSAIPRWLAVSEVDAAEPAFSTGAEPTTRSVPSTTDGLMPTVAATNPIVNSITPPTLGTWVNSPSPNAAITSPNVIVYAGLIRGAIAVATVEPTTIPSICGIIQNPAGSGGSPATS